MHGAKCNVEPSHRCHEGCTYQDGVCRYLPTVSSHHLQDEGPLVAGKAVQGTRYHSQQASVLTTMADRQPVSQLWLAPTSQKLTHFLQKASSNASVSDLRSNEASRITAFGGRFLFSETCFETRWHWTLCVAKGGWPWASDPSVSTSKMLGLQAGTTPSSLCCTENQS